MGTAAILMALSVGVTFWIWLPTAFPSWVVLHSPWIDPVVRASAAGDADTEHVGMSRLAQFGQSAVPIVLPYLKNSNPNLRRVAAAALGNIHDDRSIEALMDALDDPDTAVRAA